MGPKAEKRLVIVAPFQIRYSVMEMVGWKMLMLERENQVQCNKGKRFFHHSGRGNKGIGNLEILQGKEMGEGWR